MRLADNSDLLFRAMAIIPDKNHKVKHSSIELLKSGNTGKDKNHKFKKIDSKEAPV